VSLATGLVWSGGGYLAGTFPSTLLVAKARRASSVLATARRGAGETDPHILLWKQLGVGWMVVAATLDVLKGLLCVLAARELGGLDAAWLAVVGTLVVLGHSFPFYARDMAGRGLAAAAGVFLVLLPVPMVLAGLLICAGGALRATGLFTTVVMALVPVVAAVQGQPGALVAMGAAVYAILIVRRLEGVGDVVHGGLPWSKAVWYRVVFDSSGQPLGRRGLASTEEPPPP